MSNRHACASCRSLGSKCRHEHFAYYVVQAQNSNGGSENDSKDSRGEPINVWDACAWYLSCLVPLAGILSLLVYLATYSPCV